MGQAQHGHNLFSIDHLDVEGWLKTANGPLMARAQAAIARARMLWRDEARDIESTRREIRELREIGRDLSCARLEDSRPFTDAAKQVKVFFQGTEKTVKSAQAALIERLSLQELPTSLCKLGAAPLPRRDDADDLIDRKAPQDGPGLQTHVEIADFDRQQIPLEELRPCLTDHALRLALTKRLKEVGPQPMTGVRYRELLVV